MQESPRPVCDAVPGAPRFFPRRVVFRATNDFDQGETRIILKTSDNLRAIAGSLTAIRRAASTPNRLLPDP
ncbi:hypothetical protein HDG33_001962 [Paraburkholderia sp. Cpub6]|nr:hypothetical protein [Paraburkholderia sp. Cpub6]